MAHAADCKWTPAELTLAFSDKSDPIAAIDLKRDIVEERPAGEGGLSRNQTSLGAWTDIFFPVHAMAITAGAQSETNAQQLTQPAAVAGEWSELGNRDIDHRARGRG